MSAASASHEQAALDRALAFIEENFGLEFPDYKLQDVLDKFDQACTHLGFKSRDQLVQELAEGRIHHQDLDYLVGRLLVDESYFLRHPEQFDLISGELLSILDRTADDSIRVWSAGCARGEEPYSLALKIHMRLEKLSHPVEIMGTDLSEANLDQARTGSYSKWSLRDVPPYVLQRYFHYDGESHQLIPEIVKSVKFQRVNLAASGLVSPFGYDRPPHLILCRNVLIYMSRERARRVLQSLTSLLAPGGFVLLGPSESVTELDPALGLHDNQLPSLHRRGAGFPVHSPEPSRLTFSVGSVPLPVPVVKSASAPAPPAVESSPPSREEVMAEARRLRELGRWEQAVQLLDQLAGDLEAGLEALAILSEGLPPAALIDRCLSFISSFPRHVGGYYYRGLAAMRQGLLEEALNWMRQALYLDPGFVSGHLQTALILQRLQRETESARSLRNAEKLLLSMDPDQEVPLADGRKADEIFVLIREENNP